MDIFETIDLEIAKLEQESAPLIEQRNSLNQLLTDNYKKIVELREQRDREFHKHFSDDPWNPTHVQWLLTVDYTQTRAQYGAASQFLREQCYDLLYSDGFNEETKQMALKIKLSKDVPEQVQLLNKTLNDLHPFLKPIDGKITLRIFEHTLSQYGSYWLSIEKNNYKVIKTTYGSKKVIHFESDNLADALQYISHNLYYEI